MGKWYNIFNVMRMRMPWMHPQQMHPQQMHPQQMHHQTGVNVAFSEACQHKPKTNVVAAGRCRASQQKQLVLDANILDLQMSYREDILVMNNPQNNENFRHAAYRQYVLW
jgi:hypothetical protein